MGLSYSHSFDGLGVEYYLPRYEPLSIQLDKHSVRQSLELMSRVREIKP